MIHFFGKLRLLAELGNRECILRISTNGKVLPAFKARTLDVISYPRIKEIEEEELIIKTQKKVFEKKFLINDNISLKEIMSSQSTGRRKLAHD